MSDSKPGGYLSCNTAEADWVGPAVPASTWDFVHSLAAWMGSNRTSLLVAFSAIYFGLAALSASRVPLWADEILTAYLTRFSWHDLWGAMADGTDIEPPLFHVITRIFTGLFGEHTLAIRLPAIVGGWLMCMSIYRFVARRHETVYAFGAMLLSLLTLAHTYTTEARSYGIALGFAGVALACWQSAGEAQPRILPSIGLGLSLWAAVSCHYYMILMAVALAGGELVRSWENRRLDWVTWSMIGAGFLSLAMHLPLLRTAMTFRGGMWSAPTPDKLMLAHELFLRHLLTPALVILVAVGVVDFRRSDTRAQDRSRRSFTAPEITVVALLSLGLIEAFGVARLTNGAFTQRYGLVTVYGLAALAAALCAAYDRARPTAGTIAVVVLFCAWAGASLIKSSRPKSDVLTAEHLLMNTSAPSLLVIQDPLRFLELSYYSPPEVHQRLRYVASAPDAMRYAGSNDDDRALLLLSKRTPLAVEEAGPFLKQNRSFVLLWSPSSSGWLLQKLLKERATLTLLDSLGSYFTLSVQAPATRDL